MFVKTPYFLHWGHTNYRLSGFDLLIPGQFWPISLPCHSAGGRHAKFLCIKVATLVFLWDASIFSPLVIFQFEVWILGYPVCGHAACVLNHILVTISAKVS